jgi:3-hydroxyisobutyrate dehydrogenase-like beta-hydroxyacid dehydrogenase
MAATVAVLGMGTMGGGMAKTLQEAGHTVRPWDPGDDGAGTPTDAVREADSC